VRGNPIVQQQIGCTTTTTTTTTIIIIIIIINQSINQIIIDCISPADGAALIAFGTEFRSEKSIKAKNQRSNSRDIFKNGKRQ
jgi:hypothetical protein